MRNTFIEINLNNLKNNLQIIADKINGSKIMPIIKANAYGHGMVGIAKNLDHPSVEMLGIAYPSEGVELRLAGETRKIIIMIPPELDEITEVIDNKLDITIGHLKYFPEIDKIARRRSTKIAAHIYLNTGMNRDGISLDEFQKLLGEIDSYKNIRIEGICSHFATSEFDDKTFAHEQIKLFNKALEIAKNRNFHFKYIHFANSGAIYNLPESYYNMVRPGFAIYGLMPRPDFASAMGLKPTLSLKSHIKKIFKLQKGQTAGYSMKFVAKTPTKIAVIPIGYGDGIPLSLTNNMQCLIEGKRFNVVGSICMDQMFIDIDKENINEGEQVVLIGNQGGDEITAYELAQRANTIPYNIVTSILKRVPRIYVENNV